MVLEQVMIIDESNINHPLKKTNARFESTSYWNNLQEVSLV